MKKRLLPILLCLCMALTLLPTAALATDKGYATSIAAGLALCTDEGDTFTVDTVEYTYGGNVGTTGLTISTRPTVKTVYKAGSGYALFTPAVEGESSTPDTLTLNNATVAPSSSSPTFGVALVLGGARLRWFWRAVPLSRERIRWRCVVIVGMMQYPSAVLSPWAARAA